MKQDRPSETAHVSPAAGREPAAARTALQRHARDLTDAARQGRLDPVVGRDVEIRRLVQILARRTNPNPLLFGPSGVGKTAIVAGLAHRIAGGDVPEGLKRQRLVALDLDAVLSGVRERGELEDRLRALVGAVRETGGVLVIDDVHRLLGAEMGPVVGVAGVLESALERGERCIATTTAEGYRAWVATDHALERRFQPMLVREPGVEETLAILRGLKEPYEVHHNIRIRDTALVAAATLAARYLGDRALPAKALDLLDDAAAAIRVQMESTPQEIDEVQRRLVQLEIERLALARDEDDASRERLQKIESERGSLKEQATQLRTRWHAERETIGRIGAVRGETERTRQAMAEAEWRGDLARAAELRFATLPALRKQLADLEQTLVGHQTSGRLVREELDEDDVAAVVAESTGRDADSPTQLELVHAARAASGSRRTST
jgi:ATP-dependent Clp protease ATP-binding subunit ClpB